MATVWEWIKVKILSQTHNSVGKISGFGSHPVNLQNYAVDVVRAWGDVFCGFGVYSVQEVFFQAG